MRISISFIVLLAASASAVYLPGIPSVFTENDEVLSAISDDIANKFAKEYIDFRKTGVESPRLRQLTKELLAARGDVGPYLHRDMENYSTGTQFFACTTCRSFMKVLYETFTVGELSGPNRDNDAKFVMLEICDRFNIATPDVAEGLFDLNWKFIDYIMQNSAADYRSVCGSLPISFCKVKQDNFNFAVNIDSTGQAIKGHRSDIPKKSDSDLKILHITDIHYDPEYKEGSMAGCEEPLCCREKAGVTVPEAQKAGYWGDYRVCDSPLHTIEDAFDNMKTNHQKIDFVYQTGDNIPHNVWSTTEAGNKKIDAEVNDLIAKKFEDIPVFPVVGNHDSHPSDLFSPADVPKDLSSDWVYEHLSEQWSKFITDKDALATIKKGGYYTVSPMKGFRIISLNSIEAYMYNWWVFLDGHNALEQLQWFHDTLLAAEKANENVHILTHIPSANGDCWTVWAREYNRIIHRFHHIIGGIFNGHTHKDEINVHYTPEDHYAVAVSWNGGALTSFTNRNPNYHIYDVSAETMQVLDFESWIFKLNEANKEGSSTKPHWHKMCHFTEEFTTDASPAGLHDLLEKMAEEPQLLRKYWRCKMTHAEPVMEKGCDDKCMLQQICRLSTSVYDQKARCQQLKAKLVENLDKEEPIVTTTPGTGGATSMVAVQISTIIGFIALIKFLLL